MIKFNLPRDTDTPVRFFGYLTGKDLIRIGIPTGIAAALTYTPQDIAASLIGISTGLLIGTLFALFQYQGRTLDSHLYHLLLHLTHGKHKSNLRSTAGWYAETQDGNVVAAVKVQPVPLSMQSDTEQSATHNVLQELYAAVSFPIEIHSRQIPLKLDSYIEKLEDREETERLEEYLELCQDLNKDGSTTTQHYIVVQATTEQTYELKRKFAELSDKYTAVEPVLNHLQPVLPFSLEALQPSLESSLNELQHRLDIIEDQLNRGNLQAERITGLEADQFFKSFDHQPKTRFTTYEIPDANVGPHRQLTYLNELPAKAQLGWTVDLLKHNSSSGRVDIVQRIEPRNQANTVRKLERDIERLDAEIQSRIGGGLFKDITKLRAKKEDAEQMLDLAADNTQELLDYSIYAISHGPTPEQQGSAHQEVQNRLKTILARPATPVFRTTQAYRAESALHQDPLNESTLMPSSSAAAGFPFATSNRNEGSGIIYGTSTDDNAPILLDQWTWSSHSSAILGKTGSGKSYFVKTLLLRWDLAYQDLERIIIVDPKNEYQPIIEEIGGTNHKLRKNTSYSFNRYAECFQVPERGQKENTNLLIQLIREIYTATSQDKEKSIVVIDEAHNILREKEGRQVLEQFVREARDTNTAVVMLSQNADDFASNLEGRNILKNLEAAFLTRHAEVAEDVVEFFQLSQVEQSELRNLKTGTQAEYSEALMKVSDRLDAKFQIQATTAEHKIITEDQP